VHSIYILNVSLLCECVCVCVCAVPDEIVLKLMLSRLSQLDCVSRGWVLQGFPRTVSQAEILADTGISPNR